MSLSLEEARRYARPMRMLREKRRKKLPESPGQPREQTRRLEIFEWEKMSAGGPADPESAEKGRASLPMLQPGRRDGP